MDRMQPSYYPQQPQPQPAQAPQPKQPSGWGKLWAAFGFGVLLFFVYIAVQVAGSLHIIGFGVEENPVLAGCQLFTGTVGLLFVVALGGKAIAKPRTEGMGTAWKAALWLFLADGLFVAIEIGEIAAGMESIDIAPDWPARMLVLALLCLGVGLFEETLMRGLCLNGLLARMGRTKAGVYGSVVLSSLFFGFLHFDWFIAFDDPLQVAQNFMKVLQTGMAGYLFAAIVVGTRNLWAAIGVHAANDFMLLFLSYGLTAGTVSTDYVSTGEEGLAVLAVYTILCVLYLPMVVAGTRLIDRSPVWRGDFYHYDEPAPPGAEPPRRVIPGERSESRDLQSSRWGDPSTPRLRHSAQDDTVRSPQFNYVNTLPLGQGVHARHTRGRNDGV